MALPSIPPQRNLATENTDLFFLLMRGYFDHYVAGLEGSAQQRFQTLLDPVLAAIAETQAARGEIAGSEQVLAGEVENARASLSAELAAGVQRLSSLVSGGVGDVDALLPALNTIATVVGQLTTTAPSSVTAPLTLAAQSLREMTGGVNRAIPDNLLSLVLTLGNLVEAVRGAAQTNVGETLGQVGQEFAGAVKESTDAQETLAEQLNMEGRGLEAVFADLEAGIAHPWPALLPLLVRSMGHLAHSFGPEIGAAIMATVIRYFPGAAERLEEVGLTVGSGIMHGIERLHEPMRAVMKIGTQLFFNVLEQEMANLGEMDENKVLPAASQLLAVAAGLGASAHLVSSAAEKALPAKHLGLNFLSAFLVDLASFGGIARNTFGIQYETALKAPAVRRANRRFRPNLPDAGTMDQLFLERIIPLEELEHFYRGQGWPDRLIDNHLKAVFREASPRDIAAVFEDGEIDVAWAVRHLSEAGFSDEDAERIASGLVTKARRPLRQQALSTLLADYADGLATPDEVYAALRPLRYSDEAIELILGLAARRRVNQDANAQRQLYEDGAALGQLTDEDLDTTLSVLGFDEWARVQARQRAAIRRSVKLFTEEQADVKAAVRREQTNAINAELERFKRFELSPAGLAASLRIIGVAEGEVDSLVALAAARRTPVPRLDTVLSDAAQAQQAAELQMDVFLELQRKGIVDQAAATQAIVALGIDERRARAETLLVAARLARPVGPPTPPTPTEVEQERELALRDAAVTRFRAGLLDVAQLGAELRSAGIAGPVADATVQRELARRQSEAERERVTRLERDIAGARKLLQDAATIAFRAGRLDAGGLLQHLVAIGIPLLTAEAAVRREEEAARTRTGQRAAAELETEEAQRRRALSAAALAGFRAGTLLEDELLTVLIDLGEDPTIAQATVARELANQAQFSSTS